MKVSREQNTTDEIAKYSSINVDEASLEIDVFDKSILLKIIRKQEIRIITNLISTSKPSIILDYGCGSGWLSKLLSRRKYRVLGVDINIELLKHAKKILPDFEVAVCDAHALPFKDKAIDIIIGIGVLHHLHMRVLGEIKRVGRVETIFMEPNKLNFLSHLGRVIFPMEIHTAGEEPFNPAFLRTSFERIGFKVKSMLFILSIAFPIARLFKLLRKKAPDFVVRALSLIENLAERIPLLSRFNSTIVIHGVIE